MRKNLSSFTLQALKDRQLVRKGGDGSSFLHRNVSSGYRALDKRLDGGWPAYGVVELAPENLGIGELRLLQPVLSRLAVLRPLQAWVSVPACLMPAYLTAASRDRGLIISPPDRKHTCWVVEQLLLSACCSMIVCWIDEISPAQAKRLQVAAKESQTLMFLIRPSIALSQSLPISMRVQLETHDRGLKISVLKRQNAWPLEPFTLDLSERWPQLFKRDKPDVRALCPDNVVAFPAAATAHRSRV